MPQFEREAIQIKRAKSPFVNLLLDYFVHPNKRLIFFIEEYPIGENIFDYMMKNKKMKFVDRALIFFGIINGYYVLQQKNVSVGNLMNPGKIIIRQN